VFKAWEDWNPLRKPELAGPASCGRHSDCADNFPNEFYFGSSCRTKSSNSLVILYIFLHAGVLCMQPTRWHWDFTMMRCDLTVLRQSPICVGAARIPAADASWLGAETSTNHLV